MRKVSQAVMEVIEAILAAPEPTGAPCRDPYCTDNTKCIACPDCGWHLPYCDCV
jgi:hypothetical protein